MQTASSFTCSPVQLYSTCNKGDSPFKETCGRRLQEVWWRLNNCDGSGEELAAPWAGWRRRPNGQSCNGGPIGSLATAAQWAVLRRRPNGQSCNGGPIGSLATAAQWAVLRQRPNGQSCGGGPMGSLAAAAQWAVLRRRSNGKSCNFQAEASRVGIREASRKSRHNRSFWRVTNF